MNITVNQLVYLGPVLILIGAVLVLLLLDVILRTAGVKRGLGLVAGFVVTMVATAAAAGHAVYIWFQINAAGGPQLTQLFAATGPIRGTGGAPVWSAGALAVDYFAVFMFLAVCGVVFLVSLNLLPFLGRTGLHRSEFFPLLLISASGMMLLGMSRDLLITFIAIEVLSIPLYVLCGLDDNNRANKEASLKYFLLGAFASGFFIYGTALIYGAAGHLNYAAIAYYGQQAIESSTIIMIGFALVAAGLAFKLAMVPFHAWVPDVYQGAPTPITGFMAAGVKIAVFAAAVRLILEAVPGLHAAEASLIRGGIAVLAALSMVVGNLLALHQMSAKRLLAFSAVAHTGYIAVGLASGTPEVASSILVYLVGYGLSAIGAFALITYLAPNGQDDIYLDEMHELSQRAPVSSLAFAVLLLSMAGFPLTLGFIGKLLVFTSAWQAGLYGLVIFAVINSVVSVYYYLRFIVAMYMQPKAPGAVDLKLRRMPGSYVMTTIVTVGLTLLLGVIPHILVYWANNCYLQGF